MVHFENRAWYILALCEKVSGFWPFENKMKNAAHRIGCLSLISLFFFALVLRLVEEWNKNLSIVIENFIESTLAVMLIIKILAIWPRDEIRKQMFEQVHAQFETIVDEDEVQILRDYSERGLKFTILAILSMGASVGVYLGTPIVRMFLLYFFGDGKLEKQLPAQVDFLVDEQEYFFHIVGYMFLSLTVSTIVDFSFDLTFFLTVRHICALFKIVKLRLDRASEIFKKCDPNNKVSNEDEEKAHELISSAVDLHNEALELTSSLDEAYSTTWFFVLFLNMIALAPVPVMVMLYKHDLFESCRRSMSLIVFPLHFYVIFVQGQMTIDSSESVFDSCYDFCWYNTSKRCQVAVSIMMSRSLQPSRLTGVLFDLSMEMYSVMLKTALSYVSMFQAFDL